MTDRQLSFTDEELHAFIDGELQPAKAAEIGRAAENDLQLFHRIAAYRSDKLRLRQAYAGIATEELPEEWLRRIERYRRDNQHLRFSWKIPEQIAAAAAVILILAGGLMLNARFSPAPGDERIIDEALQARSHLLPPREILAGDAFAAGAGNSVLSKTLMTNVKAPDLSRMGYRLETARVFGGTAVELDYRNQANGLFTLYLRRPSGPPKVDIVERGNVRICVWQDEVMGAVMAGEMPAGEMARLASLAYSGLEL